MDERRELKGGYLIINSGQELERSYTLPLNESAGFKEDLIMEESK